MLPAQPIPVSSKAARNLWVFFFKGKIKHHSLGVLVLVFSVLIWFKWLFKIAHSKGSQ